RVRAPLRPGQVVALARGRRRDQFRVGVVDLKVTEFAVGDQLTVVDHGNADAGAERDDQDDAVLAPRRAEVCLGQPGGVGIVEERGGSAQAGGDEVGERDADPVGVQVGCGVYDAVEDDAGEGDADGRVDVEV